MPPKSKRKSAKSAPVAECNDHNEGHPVTVDVDPQIETHVDTKEEPVVMQLNISSTRMDELIMGEDIKTILKYNPTITEPEAYIPENHFVSENDNVLPVKKDKDTEKDYAHDTQTSETQHTNTHHDIRCYWCCHNIIDTEYGMPIRYDVCKKNFTLFGSFCSLECAAAHNYSINMGSNRVWEIHSWIQLLGKKYGFLHTIRPAPSKYLLKMFNGPLSIEEFRKAHLGLSQTCVTNIPPFIHINSQIDIINTSFLSKPKVFDIEQVTEEEALIPEQEAPKPKRRTKSDKNTLEQKMNLIIT
jgi:hypothetical protein